MTTTITADDGSTSLPVLVTGIDTAADGNNVFHTTLAGGLDITLIPAGNRSGTLELLYDDEADAYASFYLHSAGKVYGISDSDRSEFGMYYVLSGRASIALDDESRDLWKVTVEYQEVPTS